MRDACRAGMTSAHHAVSIKERLHVFAIHVYISRPLLTKGIKCPIEHH